MLEPMRLAVYPGSFDPPTLGHLDIVQRAARLFDEVIVAVGINRNKAPLMTVEERIEAIEACCSPMRNVRADAFEGLLVDYASSVGATTVVRGLRATADFEYEFQMSMLNRRMRPDIETVFLMTHWEHSYVSSSMAREVALHGGDFEPLLPPEVVPIFARAVARRRG